MIGFGQCNQSTMSIPPTVVTASWSPFALVTYNARLLVRFSSCTQRDAISWTSDLKSAITISRRFRITTYEYWDLGDLWKRRWIHRVWLSVRHTGVCRQSKDIWRWFFAFFAEKRRIFISSIFGPTILKISCTRYGTIKDAATVQIIFRERFGRSRLTSSAQKNLADKSETETSVGGNHVSPTRNCVFRPIIDGEYISKCPCCVRRRCGVPQLS